MAKKLTKKDFMVQASLTRRTFAYVVDVLILNFILLSPITKQINSIVPPQADFTVSYQFFLDNPQKISIVAFLIIIMIILTILYFSVLEFKLRQTLGKMIFGIRVMSKKANFKYSQALVRNLSKPISLLFLFDLIYLLTKKQNQRFFEKISNTAVVRPQLKI